MLDAVPRHASPCVCHCAACRAAGHGDGVCVALCAGLHELFDGKGDVVDLILRHLRHYSSAATTNYGGWTARFDVEIRCVQYGPTGDVIAAGDVDGHIHLICAQTGEKILCFPHSGRVDEQVDSIDFAPCGTKVAAACNNNPFARPCDNYPNFSVKIFSKEGSTGDFVCQLTLTGHSDGITSVSWSPDGTKLAGGGSSDSPVLIWDAASGERLWTLIGHTQFVNSVCWNKDGTKLASGSTDHTVVVWDFSTGEDDTERELRGHHHTVTSLAFKPDNPNILVTGSYDKTVKLWDLSTSTCLSTMNCDSSVNSVSWSPDGAKIAAGFLYPCISVVIFDAQTNEQLCSLRGHSKHNEECTCTHDDQYYEANPDCPLTGHSHVVGSVHFSPDGTRLVSGSWDKTVMVWDASLTCAHSPLRLKHDSYFRGEEEEEEEEEEAW